MFYFNVPLGSDNGLLSLSHRFSCRFVDVSSVSRGRFLRNEPFGVFLGLPYIIGRLLFVALCVEHGEFASAINQDVIGNQLFAATTTNLNTFIGDFGLTADL